MCSSDLKVTDYWQNYRKEHPDYVEKDNKRRHASHKKEKNAAKQDTIQRRQNGILDYLIWKESAAKQDAIDIQPIKGQ